jgi:hypothetical protein
MTEKISMNVNETLELDYLVEQMTDDTIDITSEPNNVSTSINYIKKHSGVFDPPDTGTYKLDINGQTVEIEVNDIPDSVVSLYDFEDNSDTSTAIDMRGSNDLTVNGSSYSTTSIVGSLSLSHDGQNDYAISQSATDLTTQGSTDGFGFGGWVNPDPLSGTEHIFQLFNDSDNRAQAQYSGDGTQYNMAISVNGSFVSTSDDFGTADTNEDNHVWVNVNQTDMTFYENNIELVSLSHGLDITNIGSMKYVTGRDNTSGGQFYLAGRVDDFVVSKDPLDSAERQVLIDRAN